jgi:hypothetical protein
MRGKQLAIVQIKNVTVQYVNAGKGFKVVEESTSGGKVYKQQYTVWSDAGHGFKVGDVIPEVSGLLGAKIGKPWTGNDGVERSSVELSINSPRFSKTKPEDVPF